MDPTSMTVRERIAAIASLANGHPDGVIDCNLGTPCDPVPSFVADAVRDAVALSGPYPLSAGSLAYREAAVRWSNATFGTSIDTANAGACVGTKEFVASIAAHLGATQGGDRDTILYPAVSYPTYAVGASFAGCRAVPVAFDDQWLMDFDSIDPHDAQRARILWLNIPGNPTGSVAGLDHLAKAAQWGRSHGVIVISDECYVEYAPEAHSILETGTDGVLALHSLSKRSNFAGMRCGFYLGDQEIVRPLIDLRREAGLIVPTVVQAAAISALGDDVHVREQHERYRHRRDFVLARLALHGIHHVGGPMPFYLWLRHDDPAIGGFELAEYFARAGWLIAPGATFGAAGEPFARIALVQPDEVLHRALDRFDNVNTPMR